MHRMEFALWLENQESLEEVRRIVTRPEDLSKADEVKNIIQIGDVVQLGKETQYKGEETPKYGRVVEIGSKITVQPFLGDKPIIVKAAELYRIDPDDEIAQEQQQIMKDLGRLGAKNLWIKMTERQKGIHERAKARKQKEREEGNAQFADRDTQKIDNSDIARIKQLLFGGGPTSPVPKMPSIQGAPARSSGSDEFNRMFGNEPEKPKPTGPLSARLKKNAGSIADRFAMV